MKLIIAIKMSIDSGHMETGFKAGTESPTSNPPHNAYGDPDKCAFTSKAPIGVVLTRMDL